MVLSAVDGFVVPPGPSSSSYSSTAATTTPTTKGLLFSQTASFATSLYAADTDTDTDTETAAPPRPSKSSSSSSSSSSNFPYTVEIVTGGDPTQNKGTPQQYQRVIDIAAYRNSLTNPQMMVERAQEKRDAIDPTKSALEGIKIGLLYVGPLIAALTYLGGTGSPLPGGEAMTDEALITKTLTNYIVLGGGLASALGINNFMGKSVHVPSLEEATNRIIVDLSEGILRQQDVGFVVVSDQDEAMTLVEQDPKNKEMKKLKRLVQKFRPSRGVCGTVDCQLRNSAQSPNGVRTVDNVDIPSTKEKLGPHLHIKNMDVHKSLRRQGLATSLLQEIEQYATTKTDAMALTLEVEPINQPAVRLYRKFGFVPYNEDGKNNPIDWRSKNIYMIKTL
eukprot:CAMPEP_0113465336 /NCGR_PEP_ID=MMETSP0014_2-20120614/13683_1 /TAXON_ID=2857 /ORGANISM="Nitzschia sp." /LENGTH=390 /DNA_ID=CAMNT_0000357483 /DNA_START=219 /DNA_END=1391 /DNA_ORIENTATION=+ /assembly_acc=CAM_ASM_000159